MNLAVALQVRLATREKRQVRENEHRLPKRMVERTAWTVRSTKMDQWVQKEPQLRAIEVFYTGTKEVQPIRGSKRTEERGIAGTKNEIREMVRC